MISKYNFKLSIIIIISIFLFSIILCQNYNVDNIEQFKNKELDEQTLQDFIELQKKINPKITFDIEQIKLKTTQEELDYFMQNKKWPWSQNTEYIYEKALLKNPFIRTNPKNAIERLKSVYNENTILEMLSHQTKEGKMLLNGILINNNSGVTFQDYPSSFGSFGYNSGLVSKKNDVIKCNLNNLDDDNVPIMERTTYIGAKTDQVSKLDYTTLEKSIPGFTFLKEPCNPCKALKNPPDYSCPFSLELPNQSSFVSSIWQRLWNIDTDPIVSNPSIINMKVDKNKYPLINKIQKEYNNAITTHTDST